jgi:hypothetical protein
MRPPPSQVPIPAILAMLLARIYESQAQGWACLASLPALPPRCSSTDHHLYHQGDSIHRILEHLGEPPKPRGIAPAAEVRPMGGGLRYTRSEMFALSEPYRSMSSTADEPVGAFPPPPPSCRPGPLTGTGGLAYGLTKNCHLCAPHSHPDTGQANPTTSFPSQRPSPLAPSPSRSPPGLSDRQYALRNRVECPILRYGLHLRGVQGVSLPGPHGASERRSTE